MTPRRARALAGAALGTALLLLAAASGRWAHVATEPRWLVPAAALAPRPGGAGAGPVLRVAVYGDTRDNRPMHRRVAAAIAAGRPDVVIFTGDALACLPVGHLPDLGGWQYALPLWPQVHREHPAALLASVVPFPAVLHDTLGLLLAPPRDPRGFNAFLEDSAPLTAGGGTLLFAAGNHDEYHAADRRALGALLGRPPDQLWYAVDRGGYRFVVLDTGTDLFGDHDVMPPGGAQLRWLDAVLSDAERRGLRAVVVAHLPPFSSAREEGSIPWMETRVVRGVLDRHRVALVLNGHAHAYERIVRADPAGVPVTYVVTGGGGATWFHQASARAAGSQAFVEGVYHYVALELSGTRVRGRMAPVAVADGAPPPPAAADAFEVELPPLR